MDDFRRFASEGKEKAAAAGVDEAGEGGDGAGVPASEALAAAMQLRTGEDTIAFFARYGNTCPVKFVHLNRANTGDQFRPYNLVVVPQVRVLLSLLSLMLFCPRSFH